MNQLKAKFESIDQSKLTDVQKSMLDKMKKATKDFSSDDKATNEKIEVALDNIIKKLSETNPESIKKNEPKTTSKQTTKKEPRVKKEPKTKKATTPEPKGGKPKGNSIFDEAKRIRKEGEAWKDALKRAKENLKKVREDEDKKVKSETEKLLAFIKRRKELQGIVGTTIKKDSKIQAKPKGRRISKNGKIYYEYRDNRTDRLAPDFKDNIYLEKGGAINDAPFEVELYKTKLRFDNGLASSIKSDFSTFSKAKEFAIDMIDDGYYFAYIFSKSGYLWGVNSKGIEKFEGGGSIIGIAETPLAHEGLPQYSGLVGETGALSAGEMFEMGGSTGLPAGAEQQFVNYYLGEGASAGMFENGGIAKNEITFREMDYKKLIDDVSEDFPFYSIKNGFKQEIFKDKNDKKVAVWDSKKDVLKLTNDSDLINWLKRNSYVDYEFKNGGSIKNQYEGKSPEEVWNMLSYSQKYHFLSDHSKEIESTPASIEKATKTAFKFLPIKIKNSFKKHISEGQYAKGGRLKSALMRDRNNFNHFEKHEIRYSKNRPHRKGYGYEDGGNFKEKMTYNEFEETLREYEIEGGYGKITEKGFEMYYLPKNHPLTGRKFKHRNKRKAYKEYVELVENMNKKYSDGGKIPSCKSGKHKND